MKLTRERKIIGGVLGLALVALTIDRLTAPSTDAIVASTSDDATPLLIASNGGTVPSNSNALTRGACDPSLAEQLRSVAACADGSSASPAGMRDVFHPTGDWLIPANHQRVSIATSELSAQEAFSRKHRLTAVMLSGTRSSAVIDGKLCSVGATLDRYRLVSLDRQSATFDGAGGKITLSISSSSEPTADARDR